MPDSPPSPGSLQQLLPKFYRWSDAISPLVLIRCVQPAFSLTTMLMACVSFWATYAVHSQMDQRLFSAANAAPSTRVSPHVPLETSLVPLETPLPETGEFARAVRYCFSPAGLLAFGVENPWLWQQLLKQMVTYGLWLIPIAVVLRASVTSCAERRETSLVDCLRLIRHRGVAMVAVVLIPLLAVLFVSVAFWLVGYLARLSPMAADLLMLAGTPLLIAAGVLAIGSLFAVPLAWASLLTENDCDPFDALSRGYEYTLRRLIQLAIYLLVAWGIHWVAFQLIEAVSIAGWNVSERLFSSSADGSQLPGITKAFVLHLPQVFSVVQLWALVGGIYLLLRKDANGQEIEDIKEDLVGVHTVSAGEGETASADDSAS